MVSWSPAVPPPPVCGASVGVRTGVAVTVTVTVGVGVTVAVGLAGGLVVLLAGGELLTGDELTPVGGWRVADDMTEDGEQPATATTARMAKTPTPMTVSLALSAVPAVVTRTVM
jgi:hypothetical protein